MDPITYRVPTYGRVRSPAHRMHLGCLTGVLLALAALVALIIGGWQVEYGSQHTVTFTIVGKDDQAQGNGHKYLFFVRQPGKAGVQTYEDTDAWLHGKTDSTNIWVAMRVGQTWRCPVYGYRNTVLSSYPDILDGCKRG